MRLTLKQRQAVTKQMALKYKRATKKLKSAILDTLPELTGYNSREGQVFILSVLSFQT